MIGAGGHGRVVAEAAIDSGSYSDLAFLDDRFPDIQKVDEYVVLGAISSLDQILDRPTDIGVALGDNVKRVSFIDAAAEKGFRCPPILHPFASVSRTASIAEGTVVLAGAVIGAGAILGRGCIVNNGCTVDHDCVLGEGVHISPGANLAGGVNVGCYSWIGIGATVNQSLSIGENVIVGASAAVVDDVPDDLTVVGVPARPVDS